MESSINSPCCSECPTISAEGSRLERRRMEAKKELKKIIEADLADAQMGKPQWPSFHASSLAEKDVYKIIEVGKLDWIDATIVGFQLQLLHRHSQIYYNYPASVQLQADFSNDNSFGCLEERTKTLDKVMEAVADPNTHIMGFLCSNENVMKATITLLERVIRRANRDNMFDVIVKATVTKKPNIRKIQDEIAGSLNLKLNSKSIVKRATVLQNNIKMKQTILIILEELHKGIDLEKVGIPCGADHSGCKILLTSASEDVLSNQMHAQKNFPV